MALRGVKPTAIEKRLKALFYGVAGAGKSTACASFPKPYFIDCERGIENAQYVKLLSDNGGAVFQTADFDEVLSEVKSLLTEKHDFKTLIIDPVTTVYNSLLDKCEAKVGSEFGRHYGEANKKMKHLLNLLLRLDLNVILTAHSKNEYGQNLTVLSQTFDGYKKLDYLFDLVIEIQKRGAKRFAVIKKSRIETIPCDDAFEFSYKTLSEKYGRDIIEKEVVIEKLATNDQIDELNRLLEVIKVPEEIVQKWLDKSHAQFFSEMSSAAIGKCIDYLNSKVTGDKKS